METASPSPRSQFQVVILKPIPWFERQLFSE